MKREDVTRIFEGATEEQVKGLLDIGSADITKALEKRKGEVDALQAKLDAASEALSTANGAIETLEAANGDTAKLQAEIDRYRQAETDRQETEKAERAQTELAERFSTAAGERAFIHDYVRRGVLDDFGKALTDKTNRGKSDKEVFEVLTTDKGYFASQNPPVNMGGMGDVAGVTDKERFRSMSLYEQFVFANEHPEQVKAILGE